MNKTALLALIILFVPCSSSAWNRKGHQTIAAIAYSRLSEIQKQNINTILRSHPLYEGWRRDYEMTSTIGLDLRGYVFIRAASAYDEVQSHREPRSFVSNDQSKWYYARYPVKLPDFVDTNASRGGSLESKLAEFVDSLIADVGPLNNSYRERRRQAIMLAWVLHLFGDLHQPLHVVELINGLHPQGDFGGRRFSVRATGFGSKTTLHAFWDSVLGSERSASSAVILAERILEQFPFEASMTNGTYGEWINDTARIALQDVYQARRTDGSLVAIRENSTLTSKYKVHAIRVARSQAALSGYRLAKTLDTIISSPALIALEQIQSDEDLDNFKTFDSLPPNQQVEVLTERGPRFQSEYSANDFAMRILAAGGDPIVFDYTLRSDKAANLTITGNGSQVFKAQLKPGDRIPFKATLPESFGSDFTVAKLHLRAETSDGQPADFQLFGFALGETGVQALRRVERSIPKGELALNHVSEDLLSDSSPLAQPVQKGTSLIINIDPPAKIVISQNGSTEASFSGTSEEDFTAGRWSAWHVRGLDWKRVWSKKTSVGRERPPSGSWNGLTTGRRPSIGSHAIQLKAWLIAAGKRHCVVARTGPTLEVTQ